SLPPVNMPKREVSRRTCTSLPRYIKSGTVEQIVTGLGRVMIWNESYRQAVEHVNAASGNLAKERRLSRATLWRAHEDVKPYIRTALDCTEGALLAALQMAAEKRRSHSTH